MGEKDSCRSRDLLLRSAELRAGHAVGGRALKHLRWHAGALIGASQRERVVVSRERVLVHLLARLRESRIRSASCGGTNGWRVDREPKRLALLRPLPAALGLTGDDRDTAVRLQLHRVAR